jgi:hypothetical protein
MRLKTRFSLIATGLVIFLISTPIIVLYARGLKFDLETRKFVQTGAIVVRTQPTKALVFLDDKQRRGSTPSNLRFLETRDYNLRIEKDGFQSWSKRLNVRAPFVTWANHDREFVTLFLQNPKLEQTIPITAVSVSKHRDQIAFLNNNQIGLINVNNADVDNFGTIMTPIWLSDLIKLPITWENPVQIFQKIGANSRFGVEAAQIPAIQQADTNGDYTALRLNNDLYVLMDNKLTAIDPNVSAFTLDGNVIWYIQGNLLKRYNFGSQAKEIMNNTVPLSTNARVIRTPNQIYALLDQGLFVLADDFEKISDRVTQATYDAPSGRVLFANSNEVSIYNSSTKNSELILRTTTTVENPTLNWLTGYVFYSSEGKIKAIELDGRDRRNVYDIAEDLGNFTLSEDGKTLYTFSDSEIKQYTIR